MALADELGHLGRELASAPSPLQRMKILARSWRMLRRLSPAERRRLAMAVGAEGAEEILEKLATRKGRLSPAILAPALDALKGMDPEALGRLVDVLRDPDQRREAMRKSARAVGGVLIEAPPEEPVEAEPVARQESAQERREEMPVVAGPEPPAVGPRDEVGPAPRIESHPPTPVPPASDESLEVPRLELVRDAPTVSRRLAAAREALDGAKRWSVDQLRELIELFPQDWARRRILIDMLRRGIPADPLQAMRLVDSLGSRASRRWCVSFLLHEWPLSDAECQALRERI